jgi:aryl-alcohol dehydrogenase-like predicted oxidoreductase
MQQRRIGSLEVSIVGLGCNQFGTTCDRARSLAVLHAALEAGVTLFDTADEYGDGRSEELVGDALRQRRDEVVIATKFGGPRGDIASTGASPEWIREAVDQSLRRLRTDRIDLLQLHFPDPTTPIADTLQALEELVAAGKVREIGCANFDRTLLNEAAEAADARGLRPFRSAQNRLNLLRQEALTDVIPFCVEHDVAFLPYFPLASGLLTGKYRRDVEPEPGTRMADSVPPAAREKILGNRTFDRLEALGDFAAERGRSLHQLAFAWLLAQPALASVIAGATRPEQVTTNATCSEWVLDPDEAELVTRLGQTGR